MAKHSRLEQAVERVLEAIERESQAQGRKQRALEELVTRPREPARDQTSEEIQAFLDEQGPVRISGGSDFM